jgi:hypothetical protein
MRPINWLPAFLVAAAGFVAGIVVGSIRIDGPLFSSETVLLARSQLCVERLAEIEKRLEALAATSAVPSESAVPAALAEPVRAVDEMPSTRRLEARLTAIEAVLERLAAPSTGSVRSREDPPRRPKDPAAIARLYEVEHGKQRQRTDDHQGYTAERLYERYGAPDAIERVGDKPTIQRWVYFETSDDHGVYFELNNGVVERTWAYAR